MDILDKYIENLKIDEIVICKILRNGKVVEEKIFKGNTVTATGRNQLAQLIAGTGSRPIDRMWAVVGGSPVERTTTNSKPGSALLDVTCSSAYTTTGSYTAVLTGSSLLGSLAHYNSIAVTFTLPANSEAIFTVRWSFSAPMGYYGVATCASRLGNISDSWNYPISSILAAWGATYRATLVSSNQVSDNTVLVTHTTAFSGPNTFDAFLPIISGPAVESLRLFDMFGGFTIIVGSGESLFTRMNFVFT